MGVKAVECTRGSRKHARYRKGTSRLARHIPKHHKHISKGVLITCRALTSITMAGIPGARGRHLVHLRGDDGGTKVAHEQHITNSSNLMRNRRLGETILCREQSTICENSNAIDVGAPLGMRNTWALGERKSCAPRVTWQGLPWA